MARREEVQQRGQTHNRTCSFLLGHRRPLKGLVITPTTCAQTAWTPTSSCGSPSPLSQRDSSHVPRTHRAATGTLPRMTTRDLSSMRNATRPPATTVTGSEATPWSNARSRSRGSTTRNPAGDCSLISRATDWARGGALPHRRRLAARQLHRRDPRARKRPWLRLSTIDGHLSKTYDLMPKGLIGHFPRVFTGLSHEWRIRVYECWVKAGTSAPIILLLMARWVLLAYMLLGLGKKNLPMYPWLSALTAAAGSPCTPIEQTAAPPADTRRLSALTAAACRPCNPMEQGVGDALAWKTAERRRHFEVGLLFDMIRKVLHDDGRRRRRGIGQPPRGSEGTTVPRTRTTGVTVEPTWNSTPSPPMFAAPRRGHPARQGPLRLGPKTSSTTRDGNSSRACLPRTAVAGLLLKRRELLLAPYAPRRGRPPPPLATLLGRSTLQPTRGQRVQAEHGLSTCWC